MSKIFLKNYPYFEIEFFLLPVALYGRITWSPTLMKEHRVMVCENMMLRVCLDTTERRLEKTT
jgi:hypothetical protein